MYEKQSLVKRIDAANDVDTVEFIQILFVLIEKLLFIFKFQVFQDVQNIINTIKSGNQ